MIRVYIKNVECAVEHTDRVFAESGNIEGGGECAVLVGLSRYYLAVIVVILWLYLPCKDAVYIAEPVRKSAGGSC